MPFPIKPRTITQVAPTFGNPKPRTMKFSSLDTFTGPSYSERRTAGNVIPVTGNVKDVRRFGVAVTNRGEWKR